jgi:Cell wall-active antibiotics response 4TMS YvqF/Domain of unknown function (DUF1707)
VGEPTVPRVSDRDREAAVELLKDHAVAGRVTLAELARRTEPAERAETARGLEALTSDLPVERPAPPPACRRASLVSIFGDIRRGGSWRVARELQVISGFGDVDLDLGEAAIEPDVTTISAWCVFGDVSLVVPHAVQVEVDATTIFGDVKEERPGGPPPPRAPTVRIAVRSFFGDLRVRRRGA